jgi:hypothetical protein
VPRAGGAGAGRPGRRRVLLRPRARHAARGGPHRARVGGAAHAVRPPRAPLPADGAARPGPRPGLLRGPPRGARRLGAPGLAPRLLRRARGGRPRRAGVVPGRSRPRRRLARGARHAGAAALARAHVRGTHGAPRLPALLGRVQGHGDGLLRAARLARRLPRARRSAARRGLHRRAGPVERLRAAAARGRGVAPRARRPGLDGAAAPGGGPRGPGALGPRAHGRAGADDGRGRGAQLRRELPHLARDAVRARLGPARVRGLGHRAGRRAARGHRPRGRRAAHGHRGARARLERRGARGLAGARGRGLRPPRRHLRGRGRVPGRRRDRRVVPGPRGVRPAGPGATGPCSPTRATRTTSSA